MSNRALALVSVVVVPLTLALQWVLGIALTWGAGQSTYDGVSLDYDWRWVPLWLLPADFLVVGLIVSVLCRICGRGFRASWTATLWLMVASVFAFWLLYAATDGRVVRGVPRSVEDWSVRVLHIGP